MKTNGWLGLGLRGQELLSNIKNVFTDSVEVGLYDKIKFLGSIKIK
ncbi:MULTISPECIES: hypothetical protein [Apibacter]|nr:hypothetical protein [Apibacter sp. HY039]